MTILQFFLSLEWFVGMHYTCNALIYGVITPLIVEFSLFFITFNYCMCVCVCVFFLQISQPGDINKGRCKRFK
jgi:hypothetical protein